MNVSVALATYNGGRFLPDQLASLAAQTRPPAELVVSDDASADDTPGVLRRFAATAPFPVRIDIQPRNVGTARNFVRAIRGCSGDAVALCDQDDVWRADKLERLAEALDRHPNAGLVFSNAAVVSETLDPLGYTLWDAIGFGRRERARFPAAAFDGLLRLPRVTGATAAFRTAWRDRVTPVPPGWPHDEWIALVVAATGGEVVPVDEPLVLYRQHPQQQVGGRRRGWLAEYRAARAATRADFRRTADRFADALARLTARGDVPPERLTLLAEKVRHCRARAAMRRPGAWRLPAVLRELAGGRYGRFSRGWKAALQDLCFG